MNSGPAYLNLDGIPTSAPKSDATPHFGFDRRGAWRLSQGSRLIDVEGACIRLHEAFKRAIMKDVPYAELVYTVPQFVGTSGLNSEAPLTKELFQRVLRDFARFPEINRFLYLHDCQHLVASIQECTNEVEQVLGDFYLTFNTENFFHPPMRHDDGTRYSTSPVTTKLFAYLSFIFIRLHSLLDYTVKVAFEAEHLRADFTGYPKLSSANLQYGDRKRVLFNGEAGTLFDGSGFVTMVETLRNHIIHDGLLDDMPKAYEVIRDGITVEKFILFPDMTGGRFDRHVNRNLFYGREDKINLRLPALVSEFQARQVATLERVLTPLLALG